HNSFFNLLYYHPFVDLNYVPERPFLSDKSGKKTCNTYISKTYTCKAMFINLSSRSAGVDNSVKVLHLKKGEKISFHIASALNHYLSLEFLQGEYYDLFKTHYSDSSIKLLLNSKPIILDKALVSKNKNNYLEIEAREKDVFISHLLLIPNESKKNLPDIIFIVVDSLRADVLGSYGSQYGISPGIDSFAKTSYVFMKNLVNASWTRPSTLIFFTGKYASKSYINFWDYPVFPSEKEAFYQSEIFPLPAFLGSLGYNSVMIGTNPFLTDHRYLGIDTGFEKVLEFSLTTADDTKEISKYVRLYLEKRKKEKKKKPYDISPEFLFINYNTPHRPLEPPLEFLSRVPMENGMHPKKHLYLGEVAYVDDEIKELFNFLKREKIYDSSIILLSSDHGEVMNPSHKVSRFNGVYTLFGHGQGLYEEDIHTPFILKIPEQKKGEKIQAVSRSIDIMPTILDLLEEKSIHSMDGKSMLSLVRKEEKEERLYYGESRGVKGIRFGGFKLQKKTFEFHRTGFSWDGKVEAEPYYLFDLNKDPDENTPIHDKKKEEELLNKLESFKRKNSVYSFRFHNPEKDVKEIEISIKVKAGIIHPLMKDDPNTLQPENYSNVLKKQVVLQKGKNEEFHFSVYPEGSEPLISIKVDGKEIRQGEYGVGQRDIYPGNCSLENYKCYPIFLIYNSVPEIPRKFRVQFWKKSGDFVIRTEKAILEKDSMDILKKQGYIQ
ncbi:MAG: sulfatase, partial [Leptospiraceae bacterium]|nr:sulfatase [Leptospiraceae bacterium]